MSPTRDGDSAKFSGLDRAEMLSVWNDVQANMNKLTKCQGPHEFTEDATPEREVFKKFRCRKCGGTVDQASKRWYELGLDHGRNHA